MIDAMMCLQHLGCHTCAKNILAETKHFHFSFMGDYAKEMGNSVQNEKALNKNENRRTSSSFRSNEEKKVYSENGALM